jgi:ABC-2 type transport system permease protein
MTMFVGRAFIHVIDGMVGVLLGLFWGVALFGLDLSQADPWALLLTILVTTFSTSGLGLALGSLSLITRNVMFVNNTVFFLLLIFSGANIAVDTLPAWMQAISWSLPLTRGIASAREIVAGGSLADVAPLLATEFGIGVVFVVIGYTMFRWFETQARRRGTLEAI